MTLRSIAAGALLALLAPCASACAQSADVGPMRVVGCADDRVMMVTGSPPATVPRAPVEVWSWTFYKDLRGEGDMASDSLAALYRIDCSTSVVAPQYGEAWRDGRLVTGQASSLAPFQPAPGTILALLVGAVCTPGFNPDADIFPDMTTGRAGALAALGQGG